MTRKLKLALVGLGRRGRSSHLPIYRKLSETFDFVAVCDKDKAAVHEVAQEYGVNGYSSVRDLVAAEALDVADVVVPGDAHHPICCFLAGAGINLLVETPIAPTRPMADLMIKTAARNRVKLEVAENYHRTAASRFQAAVIASGAIGEVGRIYRIFQEGGYHGMSMLRLLAGSPPKSILGLSHTTPVVPIIDRMLRHHQEEHWNASFLEFENGTAALMVYSNVIHARSLGRKMTSLWQIDGTKGTLVNGTLYYTPPAEYERGAVAQPYEPKRDYIEVEGEQILKRIFIDLPEQTIAWENPYAELGIGTEQGRGIDMADQLMSLAGAVLNDTEPTYGAQQARLDQEMHLAAAESGLLDKQTLEFPLRQPSLEEERIHEHFKTAYGYGYEEIEALIDVWYPRI